MKLLTNRIRSLRSRSLRPLSEVKIEIEDSIRELELKSSHSSLERFAILLGKSVVRRLNHIRTEQDAIILIASLVKASLEEPEIGRRLIVSKIGSVLLATDFSEPHNESDVLPKK